MATATNTTLGEIKLAGDLAGSNDGNNPQLTASGVTPGVYTFPTLNIDSKGRVLSAANGTGGTITYTFENLPNASNTALGVVKLGNNILFDVDGDVGYSEFDFSGTIVGSNAAFSDIGPNMILTVETLTGLKSVTITHTSRTISNVVSDISAQLASINASATITGNKIRISSTVPEYGSKATIIFDDCIKYIPGYTGIGAVTTGFAESTIYVNDASKTDLGLVKVGSGLTAVDGILTVSNSDLPIATESVLGVVKVGTGLSIDVNGKLDINQGDIISNLPIATNSVAGVVKIGSGLSVNGSGVLYANIPVATNSTLGTIKTGSGVVNTAGTISIPVASASVRGGIKVGNGLAVDGNGVLSYVAPATATSSTAGIVKVGSGLTVSAGVISFDSNILPQATTGVKGVVQVGTNINVSAGVISVPTATTGVKGIAQVGTNINVSAGVISVPTATTGVKGVVQIGSGLAVDVGGVLSANLPDATTGVKGVVQVGTNIDVSAGVITVPTATIGNKGVVQVGNGLTVDGNGLLSANIATSSLPGIVRPGTGLTITNGILDVTPIIASENVRGLVQIGSGLAVDGNGLLSATAADATDSVKGLVKVGSGLTASNGVISANLVGNYALRNAINTFEFPQTMPTYSFPLATTSTVTANLEIYSFTNFEINLNRSDNPASTVVYNLGITQPTVPVMGQRFNLFVVDGPTGSNIVFSSQFKFPASIAASNSTVVNAIIGVCLLEFIYLNASTVACIRKVVIE